MIQMGKQEASEERELNWEVQCSALQETVHELEGSRSRYAALYDFAPIGYLSLDEQGVIRELNLRAANLFGRDKIQIIGLPLPGFIVRQDFARCMEYLCLCRENHTHAVTEVGLLTIDGDILQIELSSIPPFGNHGQEREYWSVMTDITERKKLEKEMFRLERLNLVGEMAAGIAHEIRNPMTTVRGFLQILRSKSQYAAHREYFDIMTNELDRANSIITDFLSLAKNKMIHRSTQDLNAIVRTQYPLLSAEALLSNKNIKLDLGKIPELLLDDKEIHQLILNIACNGLQAMAAGGILTIATYCEGKNVVLTIQDQGPGISGQIIQHLGKPFLTTKENGTGLGLAICYSIVARHTAAMDVTTGAQGTSFFIRFPSPQDG